jgi:hypothetical protein
MYNDPPFSSSYSHTSDNPTPAPVDPPLPIPISHKDVTEQTESLPVIEMGENIQLEI